MHPAHDVTRRHGRAGGLKTTFALGAGAIALFAIVALALLWAAGGGNEKLDRSGGRHEPALGEPATPAEMTPSAPPPAQPATAAAHLGPAPAPGVEPRAPTPEDVDPSWRDSRIASRVRELGADAPYVNMGLVAAREAMSHCFASAPPAGRDPLAPAPSDDENWTTPAVLLLYLEARDGVIDVVDVAVESLGTESPQLVSCCREVLRGHEIRAPYAVPGRRYRLKYPLY